MPSAAFQDFEIHIRPAQADQLCPFTVRVPAEDRRADHAFALPFSDDEIGRALTWMEEGRIETAHVHTFGATLFRAIFDGQVAEIYTATRQKPDAPLRIRLIIDDARMARVPWELMYDPDRSLFLATEWPLVRGISSPEPTRPIQSQPPLRVLLIEASPEAFSPLASHAEMEAIAHSLAPLVKDGRVEWRHLPNASLRGLQNCLREAAAVQHTYHILHFMGHSAVRTDGDDVALVFEDEQHQPEYVTAETLATVARPYDLKLVLLNSCGSLQSSALDLTCGFAPALMNAGIPVVIGMQVAVLDRLAIQFAYDFYSALVDNQPVEQALLGARQLAAASTAGRAASFGVPVCFLRTLSGQIVDFPTPPRPWWQRAPELATPRNLARALVATMTFVATLLGLYWGIVQFFPTPATTSLPPMSSDIAIAVAPITLLDAQGAPSESPYGRQLAEILHSELVTEVAELQAEGFTVEVRSPALVDMIAGNNPEARAISAQKLAGAIGADILIYGEMEVDDDTTTFFPQLYLSDDKLAYADEMAGVYAFGNAVSVMGDVRTNPVVSKTLREQTIVRAAGLARFVIGLGFLMYDKYETADTYFEQANRSLEAGDPSGRKTVLLFLGSTAAHAGARSGNYGIASGYYQQALQEDPRYARAQLGAAQLLFLAARADCTAEKTNAEGLTLALEGYDKALTMPAPPLAAIQTKVAVYKGEAYLCQSLAQIDPRWEDARSNYRQVIDEYAATGNARIRYLAAEAWAGLGLLEQAQADPTRLASAAEAYGQAVQLTHLPERQAVFHWQRAGIFTSLSECSRAREEFVAGLDAYQIFSADNPTLLDPAALELRDMVDKEMDAYCVKQSGL